MFVTLINLTLFEIEIQASNLNYDPNFSDSLLNMNLMFTNRQVDLMLKSGDPDGDGQISWEEFKDVMTKYVLK